MSGTANANGPAPPPIRVGFYTTGDGRAIPDGGGDTSSGWFEERVQTLATSGYVYGVNLVTAATAQLQALDPALKIDKLYLDGHGTAHSFSFGCPPDHFHALTDPDATTNDHDGNPVPDYPEAAEFISELGKHLNAGFQIWFLACHCGLHLVGAVANALSHKGFAAGQVCGYTPYYNCSKDPGSGLWTSWLTLNEDSKNPLNPPGKATNNQILKPSVVINTTT